MAMSSVWIALASFMLIESVMGATYIVGGSSGWTLSQNYAKWVTSNTYHVGDKLEFKYTPSQHNVVEVKKADYDSCSSSSPIKTYTTGDDTIPLSAEETRYFICGVPGHCAGGMKLAVSVGASSSSSPSTPTTPATTATPPSSTSTPTPTTNSNSGATFGYGFSILSYFLVACTVLHLVH